MIGGRDRERLIDMAAYARHALDFLGELDATALERDIKTQLAVRHAVELVGEAATKVSEAGREALTDLPWRSIVGMRNTLIHGYRRIDLERVVAVVRRDLPPLIASIERLLAEHPE